MFIHSASMAILWIINVVARNVVAINAVVINMVARNGAINRAAEYEMYDCK